MVPMTPAESVAAAIRQIDGVLWASHGEPTESENGDRIAWVKFGLERSDRGWRAADFLAWALMEDMKRAGFELLLFPMMPPPFLNEPFEDFCFVLEMLERPDDHPKNIRRVAELLSEWSLKYYR
ncbi:MAG TPA: hypothetical protein VG943_02210 [Caulobacterales bacterium]|nr:hypothetical protein [Caulobacterales bacterium]